VFEYEDGTQKSYTVELLSGGARRLDLDGESFYFEEGFE
jgi:hypothetical protein